MKSRDTRGSFERLFGKARDGSFDTQDQIQERATMSKDWMEGTKAVWPKGNRTR